MFCEGRDGQRNAFCELIDHGDATFTMTVKAQDAGLHKLHVQYDEVDVPGTARGGGQGHTRTGDKVTPVRHGWSKVTPARHGGGGGGKVTPVRHRGGGGGKVTPVRHGGRLPPA